MGDKKEQRRQEERDESEAERLDRNYLEFLQELRVLQAGMQILFAFLLSLAFQSRFADVSDLDKTIYVVTLICASVAAACLTAPVPFHRLVFRRGMKGSLLVATTRYTAAGLVFLFLAMTGAILLVLDFLLGIGSALAIAGGVAAVYGLLWLAIPLYSRLSDGDPGKDDIAAD